MTAGAYRKFRRRFSPGPHLPIFCAYCREQLTRKSASRDHAIPKSRGGDATLGSPNIVPCCVRCNQVKGDRTPEEWRGVGGMC